VGGSIAVTADHSGALQKQPWLPQLQFKTIILYSRNIWEAIRGHAKCQ